MLGDRGPIEHCLNKHKKNTTVEYHECMCDYDYSYTRSRLKPLKIKHCHQAAEIYKMNNFYTYMVIGAAVVALIIGIIVAFCSCKWYFETRRRTCSGCSSLCCFRSCARRKRRKRENHSVNVFEHNETGHTWSPVNLPPVRDAEAEGKASPSESRKNSGLCMNFCLSDPVQDCCEFFDCDIMWRKKSIYTIPIFGRKKQQYFQRRPTRPAPAPPPPKAVVLPQVKHPEPVIMDDLECEPVPEAPPSPEPIRVMHSKAMYVDPLAFMQKSFLKSIHRDREENEHPEKDEAIYTKFKNVLSKVKKSASLASINKLDVSSDPSGVSYAPEGFHGSNKRLKTASLASLNNIGECELDGKYGSKRSLSLASLQMHDEENPPNINIVNDPRSRISVISSATADDIPPAARKDEYIDLEEMSRRMEAKMLAAKRLEAARIAEIEKAKTPPPNASTLPKTYTPNFIPASAFPKALSSFDPNSPVSPHYYPPVPASQGKPAVPARTSAGAPIYSLSQTGTLGRAKPVVPPRPPGVEMARASVQTLPQSGSSSPRANSLTRSPRLMKPSCPPPPPPVDKGPIESAI